VLTCGPALVALPILIGADIEMEMADPAAGALVTSLRVAGRLFHLALAATMITAAGEYDL
jgi:hypothetical protein